MQPVENNGEPVMDGAPGRSDGKGLTDVESLIAHYRREWQELLEQISTELAQGTSVAEDLREVLPQESSALSDLAGDNGANCVISEEQRASQVADGERHAHEWDTLLQELGGLHLPPGASLSPQWQKFLEKLAGEHRPAQETARKGKPTGDV